MKVALVIGPCCPGQCGVGDYTLNLRDALSAIGVEAHVMTAGDWRLRSIWKTREALRAGGFDIVHIQYPTSGFGTNLSPQVLALIQPCITTLHEASERKLLRKLSLIPFAVRPHHLIFTTSFERHFAAKWAPWIMARSSVIPVGSNIAQPSHRLPRSVTDIVHFGLITPNKGLEEVLELGALVNESDLRLVIHVIGKVPSRHLSYSEGLHRKSVSLPIVWHHDLSEKEVADKLARSSIAYLPFPDGASDRRTTLKAVLVSGLAVITTPGPYTPSGLRNVVRLCATPRESLAAIRVLLDDPQQISNLSARSVHYARRYRWERIAMLHLRLYRAVLDADSGTASALPRQLSSDRARVGEKEIDAEQAIADHPVPRGLV